jgi:uroporphyrinogen III methyltransferase/synthase
MDAVGTVYLIGAGPGDPGLITVKGLKILQAADVIIYDRLSPPELLAEAKRGAELINAGKEPQRHTLKQDEINERLILYARQGKMVARLKGGDPFIFGRGGEEAEACRAAGIPFVIVPGVSSAIAVPAYAGIPLTHRDFTSAFAVISGHEDPSEGKTSLDYEALARIGTLVFMMSIGRLQSIMSALISWGRDPSTPAVCIEWGTTERQRTVEGTISNIAERITQAQIKSPAIVVVGEVTGMRNTLHWWQERDISI